MIKVRSEVAVFVADTNLSPFPKPALAACAETVCATGALGQDVTLPAATANAPLPFPNGVATAAVLVVVAVLASDLVVKVSGQALDVPAGQTLFLYNVAAANVSVSTVLGGKITMVVGG